MHLFKSISLLLLTGAVVSVSADEQRHHDAHEHGVGMLNVAQENADLHIEFDTPAVNIVGFEHAPRSEQERETLERALERLSDGIALFVFPEKSGCRQLDADVITPLVGREEVDVHVAGHENEAEHAEQGHEHEDEETHADITATWRFSCVHPGSLDRIDVRLFEAFPLTQRLTVQFITGKRQGAAGLTASQTELRF